MFGATTASAMLSLFGYIPCTSPGLALLGFSAGVISRGSMRVTAGGYLVPRVAYSIGHVCPMA